MVAFPDSAIETIGRDRDIVARRTRLLLITVLAATCIFSLAFGAAGTSLWGALYKLANGQTLSDMERIVLWDIRAPRTLMGAFVGASLAVAGAVMQGLFRNPLADPGLVGVGAGAGLGAICAIVLGALLPAAFINLFGNWLVSAAAFLGGWGSTLLLYRVATRSGRTSVATMLLAGIALGALAGALSGLLVYMADDRQLRDLTFWGLGSLAGATWAKLFVAVPLILLSICAAGFLGRGLNAMALGEATAHHIGIPVQRLKTVAVMTVAASTGAAVAVAGGIGFVGIVVPHLLRLATGPDHRMLLPNAALLGASLLIGADVIARVVIAPAELPIGIVTAVLGAPVFLWILLRRRGLVDL
ncbi:FecCD family ABC transporter permease [Puniceibacterium sediminis]|uniref:Iron complex transport system permease protein n=1 Tax=Puniceibacterium sediminis TaxID=1608407 RepID=A0A238YRX2_9RHOB|nr:iron chelate uptake ABC transporter family permease subunit [Puniceibacterium sediminis]SNR73441.1 iron complex transport system permease protein [Puniceibacterium sediminis]